MADTKTGQAVVAQANDDSWGNSEPAVVRGAVISVVGLLATLLVMSGILDQSQKQTLEDNAGSIAVAVVLILPILQSIVTRLAVYSPRSAARVAIENANSLPGTAATLDGPP